MWYLIFASIVSLLDKTKGCDNVRKWTSRSRLINALIITQILLTSAMRSVRGSVKRIYILITWL